MAKSSVRPRFEPSPCDIDFIAPLKSSHIDDAPEIWTPVVKCHAPFPIELVSLDFLARCHRPVESDKVLRRKFESAVDQLVHHPEYNSTLILRSETSSDVRCLESSQVLLKSRDRDRVSEHAELCSLDGYRAVRMIHRRLLPRRPGRDGSLEQTCVFYTPVTRYLGQVELNQSGDEHEAERWESNVPSLLVLTPFLKESETLPYYHPAVKRLAVRYAHATQTQDTYELGSDPGTGILVIEAVLPEQPSSPSPSCAPLPLRPPDPNSRLYRTCLALLDAVHRYGWGTLTHYRKRVHHDCLIPREEYQDLYLVLRERYKHLVDAWKEATDPVKHVFEVSLRVSMYSLF